VPFESANLNGVDYVKSTAFAFLSLIALSASGFGAETAAPQSDRIETLIKQSLPVCGDMKVRREKFERKMPPNMTAAAVIAESSRGACAGEWLSVSTGRSFYLGQPWFLDGETGTIAEKVKNFGWKYMHETFTPVVSSERTAEGLLKVQIPQTTERGQLPLEGLVDPAGTIFFVGHFHPIDEDPQAGRLKTFQPFVATAPGVGPADAKVTVVEFSDFECPSCRLAATNYKPIFDKYGDKIRYVRYDLPLIGNHPWAFSAAVAGRAIFRQKPDAFWQYKKQVYDNQDRLTAFTIDDFARGFAQDHELDLKKYDTDVNDPALQKQILAAVATAFMNDIRATPSYLVNGALIDPGTDGGDLDKYIAAQLAR
jgi:hypothetical protein